MGTTSPLVWDRAPTTRVLLPIHDGIVNGKPRYLVASGGQGQREVVDDCELDHRALHLAAHEGGEHPPAAELDPRFLEGDA